MGGQTHPKYLDKPRTKKKTLLFKILKILIRFLHGLIEFNLLCINLGKLFATLFANPSYVYGFYDVIQYWCGLYNSNIDFDLHDDIRIGHGFKDAIRYGYGCNDEQIVLDMVKVMINKAWIVSKLIHVFHTDMISLMIFDMLIVDMIIYKIDDKVFYDNWSSGGLKLW